jgi:hypothetical protein
MPVAEPYGSKRTISDAFNRRVRALRHCKEGVSVTSLDVKKVSKGKN